MGIQADMKSWELIFFERVARCRSKCCRRLCSPSSTWVIQCSSPHVHSAKLILKSLRNIFFENIDIFAMGWRDRSYRVLFGADCKKECESHPPMRTQLGSTRFAVWGRSSSFHTFFQDCVRGQHLCLAHAERSSSHPKTNKYWGFVWLFLALITIYIRL